MQKIISLDQLPHILTPLTDKKIILAGGCFDILHKGHIAFLGAAKKQGDTLVVLLESDEAIRRNKGENRPVNTVIDRARILATLPTVDYIVMLPDTMTDEGYDNVVLTVKPAIIATTKGDPFISHKERQAKLVDGSVFAVIDRLPEHASTKLAESIQS